MHSGEDRVRHFVRMALAAAIVLLVGAAPARAQRPLGSGDIAGSYSSLTDVTTDTSSDDPYRGWLVSGSWPVLWPRLLATGELDNHTRTNDVDETSRLLGVLGGARYIVWRNSRLAAFGQAQFGVERFSEPGFDESGFAMQPGGGVDVRMMSSLAVRVQADYRFSTQNQVDYREVRLAVGAVFNLGRR